MVFSHSTIHHAPIPATPPCLPPDANRFAAKSKQYGGDTLVQHTWDVLARLTDLIRLHAAAPVPQLPPHLWHCLYWAGFLHDFGKASPAFQRVLAGRQKWPHRHEVVSLAFVDWLAADLPEEQQLWLTAAIAAHHKDAPELRSSYPDLDAIADAVAGLDEDICTWLWQWLDQCGAAWYVALGLAAYGVQPLTLVPLADAQALPTHAAERIMVRLQQYRQYVRHLDDPTPPATLAAPILLRGLLITADHLASAGVASLPHPLHTSWSALAQRNPSTATPYAHQQASAAHAAQSLLLAAPTGSGKTEAALYWAVGDGSQPVPRLFYALPYQASMNAMYDRLRDAQHGFGEEVVGVQHGRAVQALYARLMQQEHSTEAADAAHQAARRNTMTRLHAVPIKVFSPYQLLKAMFQVRGFEASLSDYAGASFIFDEIHAYDPERLALFLAMVAYLREGFAARFCVMSATFPAIIREHVANALGGAGAYAMVTADADLYRRFSRHRLHLLDGELLPDGIERIVADFRAGKQVLVCANTVRRAQDIWQALLAAGVPREQTFLLHSRFTMRDRNRYEQKIREACGLGQAHRQPLVVVATQVVEVSLNLDLDTIYTDPAPLEALLQRFGRVNRTRRMHTAPVHVFTAPTDGQGVYGRHNDPAQRGRIVQVTLAELAQHEGQLIDEAAVGAWLDRIYADAEVQQQWQDAYGQRLAQAQSILRSLRPFTSDEQTEAEFERLFDGIEVLPKCFETEYVRLLVAEQYLEASQLLVNISKQHYAMCARAGWVRAVEAHGSRHRWLLERPYDAQLGLLFEDLGGDPDWTD